MAIHFDDERRKVFLKTLTETLNVSGSARAAGVCKRTVYNHYESDAEFARAWDEALDEGLDLAEQSVNRRAFQGVDKPVFYKGTLAGQWVNAKGEPADFGDAVAFRPYFIREYSDTLAMFMLKAHRPEKFRDKLDLDVKGEITVTERIIAARKRAGG